MLSRWASKKLLLRSSNTEVFERSRKESKMENNKIINAEKSPPEVQNKFIPYLKLMSNIHTDHLISVFIYGSAAGKNYIPKISDINSVFVFKDLAFASLTDSLKTVSKGISKRIAAPYF